MRADVRLVALLFAMPPVRLGPIPLVDQYEGNDDLARRGNGDLSDHTAAAALVACRLCDDCASREIVVTGGLRRIEHGVDKPRFLVETVARERIVAETHVDHDLFVQLLGDAQAIHQAVLELRQVAYLRTDGVVLLAKKDVVRRIDELHGDDVSLRRNADERRISDDGWEMWPPG